MSYSSVDSASSAFEFNFGVRLGMVFIVESAALSALAVSSLLLYIGYSTIAITKNSSRTWTVSSHVHYYFVNLLVADLIQATGGLMDIRWIADAGVVDGAYCSTQGVLKQIGDVGVAFTSMAIAVHTFLVLVFRLQTSPKVALGVVCLIWVTIALFVGISLGTHRPEDYYSDTQYWCWISGQYPFQRIALEYFWLWLAAFVNIVCYLGIALVIKGFIMTEGRKVRFRRSFDRTQAKSFKASMAASGRESVRANAIAMQMLFYPAVYIVTVFPISVVRFMAFSGAEVPFGATAFSSICFSSSGLLNVLLFRLTRPKLLPDRSLTTSQMTSTGRVPTAAYQSRRISLQRPYAEPSDDPANWKVLPHPPSPTALHYCTPSEPSPVHGTDTKSSISPV